MNEIDIKRKEIQDYVRNILDDSYKNKKINFIECPTGSGKTNIILESAVKLKNKYGKSVIISTSSNELALKFINEGIKDLKKISNISVEECEIELMLGRSNFVDINAVKTIYSMTPEIFKEKDKKDIDEWFRDSSNRKLVDIFLKDFDIPISYKDLITFDSNSDEIVNIKNFVEIANDKEPKIFVTNHLYLITLVDLLSLKDKDQSIFLDIPIFLDEAHDLIKLAELKFTKTFSTFNLKNLIEMLIYDIQSEGKTPTNALLTLKKDTRELFEKTINNNYTSLSYKQKGYDYIFDAVNSFFQKYHKKFHKIISKNKGARSAAVIKEFNELLSIMILDKKDIVNFNFTGKRGFLKITALNKTPKLELRKKFWQFVGNVYLFSGTLRVEAEHLNAFQNKWIINKIGLLPYEINEDSNSFFVNFNNRIYEDTTFKCFKWIFDRANFKYCIIEDDYIQPISYKKEKTKDDINQDIEEWGRRISHFYSYYYDKYFSNGNTLILTGSYQSAQELANFIKEKGINEKSIFYETTNESQGLLIKRYAKKALTSKGNIIIGTLSFYTGINLKGDLCHNIIMTKLPYAPFSKAEIINKKDISGVYRRNNYEKEMRLLFRQGIGRGSRVENDKVALFILDKKIRRGKKATLINFLEEMGEEFDFNLFIEQLGDYKGDKNGI